MNAPFFRSKDNWRYILKKARKRKIKNFDGTRKTEVTIRPNGMYHPHYHIIIDGKENAKWLVNEWLKKVGSAKEQGQDIRKIESEKGYLEIAKYQTKTITKNGKEVKRQCPRKLDTVYNALRKKRMFQSFGNIKKKIETFNEEELIGTETVAEKGLYEYSCNLWDWKNKNGQLLTGLTPSKNIKKVFHYKEFKPMPESWRFLRKSVLEIVANKGDASDTLTY